MTADRPHRQRKGDRLIVPGANAAEIACDYALAPFDRAAEEMERKWGIDRLPALVSPETARKYGSAMAKLNAAIAAEDPAETAARVAVCIRGMAAMDAEATSAGHRPTAPECWAVEWQGAVYAVVRSTHDWPAAKRDHPGALIVTLRELVAAHAARADLIPPIANPAPVRQLTALEIALDDEIPF
jgi:hypothetical protein